MLKKCPEIGLQYFPDESEKNSNGLHQVIITNVLQPMNFTLDIPHAKDTIQNVPKS